MTESAVGSRQSDGQPTTRLLRANRLPKPDCRDRRSKRGVLIKIVFGNRTQEFNRDSAVDMPRDLCRGSADGDLRADRGLEVDLKRRARN